MREPMIKWPKGGKPYVYPTGNWTTGYGRLRGLDCKRVNKNSPTLAKDQGEAFPTPELLETAIRMNGGAPLAA